MITQEKKFQEKEFQEKKFQEQARNFEDSLKPRYCISTYNKQ